MAYNFMKNRPMVWAEADFFYVSNDRSVDEKVLDMYQDKEICSIECLEGCLEGFDFGSYMYLFQCISIVKLNDTNWKLSRCNCPYYSKNYMCRHIILIAVAEEIITFPLAYKQAAISKKTPRGRIPNAKLWYDKQNGDEPEAKKKKPN
jgi:hypothetical protein